MWALWQQILDRFWGVILWVEKSGHWQIIAGICIALLLYIVYRRRHH